MNKRHLLIGATSLICVGLYTAHATTPSVSVFVLGVDGMDPVITQRLMNEGKLPNITALTNTGAFRELGTTTPPQSPVAWSTFVTGMDPGGHGLFDFIHRNPKTYDPISSATPPIEEDGWSLNLFGYALPVSSPEILNNRSGTPFWDILKDNGVDVEVYRIPGNYPTPPSQARVLAGMGTVDMRGGYGTYTWVTDAPIPKQDTLKGDVQVVTVVDRDLDGTPDTATAQLKGPPNIFQMEPGAVPSDSDYLTVPVKLQIDPEFPTLIATLGTEQVLLKEGEWSSWIPVTFSALPMHMADLEGRIQMYVKEVRPNLQVYISPVNIAAGNPAQAISSPDGFASDIHAVMGDYYTQGMPEETNALSDGLFTDAEYIQQVGRVQKDTQRMLDVALKQFEPGDMTFFYLSDIDLQCHMLWRHGDPKHEDASPHPSYEAEQAALHRLAIESYYKHVDDLIGDLNKRLPAQTTLLVMSDHGFQPYTRRVHLNAWLRDNGWLVLKENKKTGYISTGDVDWSKTRAYGLGFNGLYLNVKGREGEGIVPKSEMPQVKKELTKQLLAFMDPLREQSVVLEVADTEEIYSSTRSAEAPDLVVGYNIHYGASDESTLGEITETVLEDNTDKWSGSHLMAPSVVPGLLMSNQPFTRTTPMSLPDVTASVLDLYGLNPSDGMVGTSIFR